MLTCINHATQRTEKKDQMLFNPYDAKTHFKNQPGVVMQG